ncbi:pyridoxal-phosphate dependent enzyme [[Kitasatospora] papulosa]|uniref:PLP-dependent cysteine synthase family protein n=1 Tax=Streptomyces TaxID=1883 RepID=UPI0002C6A074|nr:MULTISPECIES: pyridoxal-phosphate dependent enzyme [Streptomyces]MBD2835328.1 pyridoxal-phosphate dependent enzyme [Streptomyces pratensis]TPM84856.1 pyridoxal-phosphate dependent enzyme [Mesorhizobium sp. B2-3-3]AGJ58945.1 cysteine synthase [Streptomyces sp. PAMC 26508]MCX4416630.1 pyridoxal-phosphate dependent enzyme [[Kitasatospora] papulosa]MCY1677600.1 pyridoxal-phosphate dependent enzyme [Streptomyces sp. SL294]
MTTASLPALAPNRELLALIGRTPLARITTGLPLSHPGFWAKLEGHAVGGMKARAAVSMLLGAEERGELLPGAPVVESTSGTLGIGLAFAGQALGHPVVLVGDSELEPSMRQLLRSYGARLELVDRPKANGGWQGARLDRLHDLLARLPGAYWPDQYNNPDNTAGYASLAAELAGRLAHLDILVCSVGTGGHSAGIAAPLRRHWPGLRLIAVDSTGSTIFGQTAAPRLMRGLGSSIHPRNVAYDAFDEVHWIGPAEAADACRRLARGNFVSGGWSTGAVARVAAWAARTHPGAAVATVFPDGPHRYLGSVYDDDFMTAHRLNPDLAAVRPVDVRHPRVPHSGGWTRCTTVTDPLADSMERQP